MAVLVSIPVCLGLLMLQTALVSQFTLLNGSADLVLLAIVAWALQERPTHAFEWALIAALMVGAVSAVPVIVPVATFVGLVALARFFRRRVWRTPVLAMFSLSILGTLMEQGLTMASLWVGGVQLPILDSVNRVVLPSLLLNMLLALPVYAMMSDLAESLYPLEVEV